MNQERNHELVRALQLCRLIATDPLTLKEIAARLGVGVRTIRRDVAALRFAGVDIVSSDAPWAIDDDGPDEDELPPAAVFTRRSKWSRAKAYRLDKRAWYAVLHLPADGRESLSA